MNSPSKGFGKSKRPRSPLKDKPLRSAGQSLDELRRQVGLDAVLFPMLLTLLFGAMALGQWLQHVSTSPPSPWIMTVVALLTGIWLLVAFLRFLPLRQHLLQGAEGERAVAQYLERFRADGYHVFHDVLNDGLNIDHVLIGPAGVFSIETKTWSKPGSGQAVIEFDGEAVRIHGSEPDRNPVIQARAQANWLKRILQASTGRQPDVLPVVVFPGWFIRSSGRPYRPLWVLEPKALPSWLANQPKVLTDEDVHLFAFHLSRYIRGNEKERERMPSLFGRG